MNTLSRLICTFAAGGLAFIPVAAQANTRAGDNSTIYTTPMAVGSGIAASTGVEDEDDENEFFVYLLAGSWATGIIFIIFEDDNQSPGGN